VTRMHVACAAERNYLGHSAAMLHSVLANADGLEVEVHYMHGGDIRRRDEERLAAMVGAHGGRVEFLHVPDTAIEGLPTKGFTRKATWYRVLLPEMRPDLERALYLDSDLIAVDSLEPLWALDTDGYLVAAVTNVFEEHHYKHERLGPDLPQVRDYFNAGVLLMNLEEMRRAGSTSALLEYGRARAQDLKFRDQDVLNAVLGSRRLPLHPRWNCMNSILLFSWAEEMLGREAVAEARAHPAIRHFEGPYANKPWHLLADEPTRDLYLRHRRATPWPRVRPVGVTPVTVAKRLANRRGVSA
jgi:UDP-glucose/galactose:(glucosyl)LPS alpha-1,2-glucosyl/galactosyltransferase